MQNFKLQGSIEHSLDSELVKNLKANDEKKRAEMWEVFQSKIPHNADAITRELKSLYEIYDDGLIKWMANLYDPDICICNEVYGKQTCEHHPLCGTAAFHYTHSARDNVGFAPVIEGTLSVYNLIEGSGVTGGKPAVEFLHEVVGDKIKRFALNLQDPDGYFYHPQWGKNIGIGRRARDYDRAIWMLNRYDTKPRYATISDTGSSKSDGSATLIPDHLKTPDAFREYLESLDIDHRSYSGGSVIAAQFSQIAARGKEYTDLLGEFLDAHQREDNGIWNEEVNYAGINGLMKISGPYCHMHRPMPNPEKAVRAAISAIISPESADTVVTVWNPWVALERVLYNIQTYHEPKTADKIRREFLEMAPEAIRITKEKTLNFKHKDGSFSYLRGRSTHTMQGSPCAMPNVDEGDMDAAILGTNSMIRAITDVLGVSEYKVPLFGSYEGAIFLDILKNRKPVRKYKD